MYIEGSYNFYMVALSIIIGMLASYSTLRIASRSLNTQTSKKFLWLITGSIVMGSWIWAAHTIGMLAFHLPVPIEFNIWMSLISIVVSIGLSFIAFFIVSFRKVSKRKTAAGGCIIGIAVMSSHYIGTKAMIIPALLSYDKSILLLSIIIALIGACAALFLFVRSKRQASSIWMKRVSAIIMGTAISGMHYTGMTAIIFYTDQPLTKADTSFTSLNPLLLYSVTIVVFIIFTIS